MSDSASENPYSAPRADLDDSAATGDRARVLAAARGQRHANLLILTSIVMMALAVAKLPGFALLLPFLQLVYVIVMAVIVFRAVRGIHGTLRAVIYALLSWVPILNILLLLTISSTATKLLRENGFRVGLLGTNLKSVEAWASTSQ